MDKTQITLYFDMDGVIAVFEEQQSQEKPFNILGRHYFLTCRPDKKAIAVLHTADQIPGWRASVLSRIYIECDDPDVLKSLLDEHEADKTEWCRKHIQKDSHAVPVRLIRQEKNKNTALSSIPKNTRAHHVLIDDDPAMLNAWRDGGGTGVQYLHHKRTAPAWGGPVITDTLSVGDAIELIESAAYKNNKRKEEKQ